MKRIYISPKKFPQQHCQAHILKTDSWEPGTVKEVTASINESGNVEHVLYRVLLDRPGNDKDRTVFVTDKFIR